MDGKANHSEKILEDQSLIEHHLDLDRVFRTNLTMREVAQLKDPTIQTREEAILALKIGNARFFSGQRLPSDFSAIDRRAQLLTQTPFAVVLGCSDSRVPTEIIYDQRAGDLFVNRLINLRSLWVRTLRLINS
jgi:carbonic anhydrase